MSGYSKKFAKKLEPFLKDRTFTVSEFVDFVNGILEPLKISKVTVRGEIGEDIYKNKQKGWMIINLVDEEGSQLNCFSPSYVIDRIGVDPEPGMEIKITGYPKVLKNKGRFSFQINRIGLVGEGDLKKQFEVLKKRLKEAGYFKPEKKESIPIFPERIGLITSKGSDAEKDFFTHLEDYGFNVKTYNSRVEGDLALDDLLKGINLLNQDFPDLQALVITRGGGSWESLQAFNNEELVKTAFSSKIPIISGIGHENDVTLLDLVADKRVSTPTDAGKFLSRTWREGEKHLLESEKNLSSATKRMITQTERRFDEYSRFFARKIETVLKNKSKSLDYLINSLTNRIKNKIEKFYSLEKEFKNQKFKIKTKLKNNNEKVDNLSKNLEKSKLRWEKVGEDRLLEELKKLKLSNPELKLSQGYSITRKKGSIVKSASNLKKGDLITTDFKDGTTKSQVKNNE